MSWGARVKIVGIDYDIATLRAVNRDGRYDSAIANLQYAREQYLEQLNDVDRAYMRGINTMPVKVTFIRGNKTINVILHHNEATPTFIRWVNAFGGGGMTYQRLQP